MKKGIKRPESKSKKKLSFLNKKKDGKHIYSSTKNYLVKKPTSTYKNTIKNKKTIK